MSDSQRITNVPQHECVQHALDECARLRALAEATGVPSALLAWARAELDLVLAEATGDGDLPF